MTSINTPTYMRLREVLRNDIVSGVWPLGSHMTLAQLSSHYQVSNAPVREALLQLQGEGVVAMRMNRGAVVPLVNAQYIEQLYMVRGALQSMVAREAARIVTVPQTELLMQRLAAHEAAVATGDPTQCLLANRAFHQAIDEIAANSVATEMLAGRSSLVDAFRRQVGYGEGRLDLVVRQHRRIAEAIVAHDEEAAVQASIEHTDSSRIDLIAAFRSQPQAVST